MLPPAGHLAAPRPHVGLHLTGTEQVLDDLDEFLDDEATVADDRHVRATHLALLRRVDIDVDDLGLGGECRHLAGDAVVEPGAERNEEVTLLHRRDGRGRAVHTGHPEVQRVAVRERSSCHQRGDHGDLGEFGQFPERLGGASLEDAAPDIEHRALAGQEEFGCLLDHLWVPLGDRPITGERVRHLGVRGPVPVHGVGENVLGDVDQHRAGATRACEVEGLTDHQGEVLGAHHQFVVLGDAAGDADGVALLERVGADRCGGHLTGDANHRNRVHERIAQRRDHVGGCWPRCDHRNPGTARDVGVSLSHVAGTLFVAHEDVTNRGIEKRVVRGQDAAAGQAEHDLDVLHLERLDERLGSGQFHGTSYFSSTRASGWVRVGVLDGSGGKSNRPPAGEVNQAVAAPAGAPR